VHCLGILNYGWDWNLASMVDGTKIEAQAAAVCGGAAKCGCCLNAEWGAVMSKCRSGAAGLAVRGPATGCDPVAISRRGFRPRKASANGPNPLELLPEIGERRLKSMDEAGITV
jgi:hypothetical protein